MSVLTARAGKSDETMVTYLQWNNRKTSVNTCVAFIVNIFKLGKNIAEREAKLTRTAEAKYGRYVYMGTGVNLVYYT